MKTQRESMSNVDIAMTWPLTDQQNLYNSCIKNGWGVIYCQCITICVINELPFEANGDDAYIAKGKSIIAKYKPYCVSKMNN